MNSTMLYGEMLPQAMKGLMASLGAGSGLTKRVQPALLPGFASTVQEILSKSVLSAIVDAGNGCTVTLASKVVSVLQGRYVIDAVWREQILSMDLEQRLQRLRQHDGTAGLREVLIIDFGRREGELILAPEDPNRFAYTFSQQIYNRCGVVCDVLISDSGAGEEKGRAIIGTQTFFATPLGCTRGLTLVHAQRCAVIAEHYGNKFECTPLCVIEPQGPRTRRRPYVGKMRYGGYLDARRESLRLPDLL